MNSIEGRIPGQPDHGWGAIVVGPVISTVLPCHYRARGAIGSYEELGSGRLDKYGPVSGCHKHLTAFYGNTSFELCTVVLVFLGTKWRLFCSDISYTKLAFTTYPVSGIHFAISTALQSNSFVRLAESRWLVTHPASTCLTTSWHLQMDGLYGVYRFSPSVVDLCDAGCGS